MSSQGATGATGYAYPVTRDAQDWTRRLKELKTFVDYRSQTSGNKDAGPTWMKFGNDFKLVYDFGKLACNGCTGNAFGGTNSTVGGS